MDRFKDFFHSDLVFFEPDFKDRIDCFTQISDYLYKKGFVKKSFLYSIIEREENYPTGLKTDYIQLAIPHTDSEHVIKPFITVIKPKQTIPFIEMGTDDKELEAQFIFVLGITNSGEQVHLLQQLIDLFMNKNAMSQLLNSRNKESIYNVLKNNI